MIDKETFQNETSLILDVLVDQVLTTHTAIVKLSAEQEAWFRDLVDRRILWQYEHKTSWKKWLRGKDRNVDPRDQAMVWIRHWYDATVAAVYNGNFDAFEKAYA